MVGNKIKMKIKVNKKNNLKETSIAAGVAGFAGRVPEQEEKKELEELYSTSGAYMSSGGSFDRSKKGHKRYIRMRYTNQNLQNFKPNRYFVENKNEERKIRIKIRKNLEENVKKAIRLMKNVKPRKCLEKHTETALKQNKKQIIH